jgi:MFS family permease
MQIWIQKIIGFGLASFFSDFSHEMTVSLIPVLVAQFVGSAQAPLYLGIIASLSDAFAAFLRLFSGYLSDRTTRKKPLIAIGYALSALFTMLVGLTHSIRSLFTCRILSFTGSGLREPPRDALIAASVDPTYYGRAFGLKNAMDTLGSLIGPIVSFVCIGYFSTQHIFLLSLIPGILSVAAIIFLTSDIPVPAKNMRIQTSILREILRLPKPFMLFLVIMIIFDLGVINKLLLIARAQQIFSSDRIAQLLVLLYAIFNATRAGTEFLIGWTSDYINRIQLLALLGCGTLALNAYMLITPHASLNYCILLFIIAGISTATVTTLKKACAADMLPEEVRGLGFGLMQGCEGFATLISSACIGFLWTHYSPLIGFSYVILVSLTAMILLLIFNLMQHKQQTV